MRYKLLAAAAVLLGMSACQDAPASSATTNPPQLEPLGDVEQVLFDQLACKGPPRAAVVVNALLREHYLAEGLSEGADSISVFKPIKDLTLFGFPVIRVGGLESDFEGPIAPFTRGPGTLDNDRFMVTIIASPEQIRQGFMERGVDLGGFVDDMSQNAVANDQGQVSQPQRLSPGPMIEDDNYLLSENVAGATTISCSATPNDFADDITARIVGAGR